MSRFAGKVLACVFLFCFAGTCIADGGPGPAPAQAPADHRDKARSSQGASGALGDTVMLSTREPSTGGERIAAFLARELVRQAFLIAARDEFGLSTRDATLGEPFPESPNARQAPFELYCTSGILYYGKEARFELRYTLSRGTGPTQKKVWAWKTEVPTDEMLKVLTERTEALSRGELKDVVKRLGAQPTIPPARPSAELAQETFDQLYDWNEIAVLGALRKVHAEIHAKGESPELLGALAAGYANLGSLTAYYFSPATKAYSARALLYAERLMRQSNASAWALWHRAYVRALVGLHNLAAADVAAAKGKPEASSGARPLPFWAPVIEQFCNGKVKKMHEVAKSGPQQRLANYLNLDAVNWGESDLLVTQAAESVTDDTHDCLRAWDALGRTQVQTAMAAAERMFLLVPRTIRQRVPKVPGLPEPIAKRIADAGPIAPGEDARWQLDLVTDLFGAAAVGPTEDRMEPSLGALAHCIDEIQFKELFRRVELLIHIWIPSTELVMKTLRPLCARHKYAAYADAYDVDQNVRIKAGKTILKKLIPSELGYVDTQIVRWLYYTDPQKSYMLHRLIWAHMDHTFRDEMLGLKLGAMDYWGSVPYLRVMNATSSKLPEAVAVQVDQDWKHLKGKAAQLEKDYEDEPSVMAAFSRKYMEDKRLDDAERCAKRWVALLPDYPAYKKLASIYKKKGDTALWKDTLVKAINLKHGGLEPVRMRNEIAQYHMGRQEWKEAIPFADAAAESEIPWAVDTDVRCHEMLGHWEKAEEVIRATSQDSGGSDRFEWLLWCCRTGRGDREAAEKFTRNFVESFGPSPGSQELEFLAAYHLLVKEPEKASKEMKQAYAMTPYPYFAMQIALMADTRGDAAERDEYYKKTVSAGAGKPPTTPEGAYARIVELLQKMLASGNAKDLDRRQVDEIIGGFEAQRENAQYFVGMFLKNHGDPDGAREYLDRCAASLHRFFCRSYAARVLREMKNPDAASQPANGK